MESAIRQLKESEGYQKIIDCVSEGREGEEEQKRQNTLAWIQELSGLDKELFENIGGEVRRAVEAKRKGRGTEKEQDRKVRFAEEDQTEETRAQRRDTRDVMSGLEEVRTGRGCAGLVRRGDERRQANETSGRGKGKGNGGKGEHGSTGEFGGKGFQQSIKMMKGEEEQGTDEEDERVQVAPNMGAGGSYPQAMADPEEDEAAEE